MKNRGLSAKWRNVVLTIIYIAVLFATVWRWPSGLDAPEILAQGPDKSLQKLESYPNEPLEIVDIKAANKTVSLGEQFSGDDDWLKNASFKVKNVSGKDIIYIEIDLNFPETKASGSEMSYRLKLGHRPAAHDVNPPLLLRTNEEAVLGLEGSRYEQLVKFLQERYPISAIRKASIRIGFVIFLDGTGWSGGLFHRRDPNNPNRYLPVSK